MRSFAFRLLVGILTLGVLELSVRVAFPFLPGFERTRLALRGGLGAASQFQNCIGQAYLLYAPSPAFSNEHGLQHNSYGYRGPFVDLERKAGFKRVLFLGGSTTYDWRVARPSDTYPVVGKDRSFQPVMFAAIASSARGNCESSSSGTPSSVLYPA